MLAHSRKRVYTETALQLSEILSKYELILSCRRTQDIDNDMTVKVAMQ